MCKLCVCVYTFTRWHADLQGVRVRGHLSEQAHKDLDLQMRGLAFKALC